MLGNFGIRNLSFSYGKLAGQHANEIHGYFTRFGCCLAEMFVKEGACCSAHHVLMRVGFFSSTLVTVFCVIKGGLIPRFVAPHLLYETLASLFAELSAKQRGQCSSAAPEQASVQLGKTSRP